MCTPYGVRLSIHPGCCREVGRERLQYVCIKRRRLGDQLRVDHKLLVVCLGVGDYGDGGCFRSRARSGWDHIEGQCWLPTTCRLLKL